MDEYKIFDYPPPDPDWDYYGIWYEIQRLKVQTDDCIKYMNDIESATVETNHSLAEKLEDLQIHLNSAIELLKNRQLPY